MSTTTVNLGYVPKNRGEYSSTASYYKDNIVQYNGSSYICNPPNYDPDTAPTASITGVAPYASDPAVPNTGWAVFCNDSSGVGEGVYNVSVDHTTDNQPKIYASLSAALNDIPAAKKKGGMEIRFIFNNSNYAVDKEEGITTQPAGTLITSSPTMVDGTYKASQLLTYFSTLPTATGAGNAVVYYKEVDGTYTTWTITLQSSDNKYVQYRLMNQNWSTVITDWQGVDDEPTAGSKNLIESGGVEEQISKIYGFKEKEYQVSINAEIVTFEFPVKIPNGQTVTLTAKTENAVINMFRVYVNEIDTLHPIMEDANSTVQYTATEDVTKLILYVRNTTAAGSLTFTTDYNIDFSLENAFREINGLGDRLDFAEKEVIYDVSAHNDNAVFESLSALLSNANLNTLIPPAVRCGGMSIRFRQGSVPNSDNKYMQARCMAQTFTTDISAWQGVDNEPTAGSDNLVKSGGVYEEGIEIKGNIDKEYQVAIDSGIVTFDFPVTIKNGETVTLTAKTEDAVINMFRVYANEIDTLNPIMENANSTVQYTANQDVSKLILYVRNTTAEGKLFFEVDYNKDFSLKGVSKEIENVKSSIPIKISESEYNTFGVFKKNNSVDVNPNTINLTIPIPKIKAGHSVRLLSKGDATVGLFRIYGNASGQNNTYIESVNDEVVYIPDVDINSLVLLISNCTVAGNIEITVLDTDSVEGNASYANNRIDSLPDCYGKALDLRFESGCFLYANGSAHSNVSYKRTSYLLPVKEGDTFVFLADAGANVAVVAAYDGHNRYLKEYSVKGNDGYTVVRYVVPQGVKKVRFTLSSSDNYTPFVTQIFKSKTEQLDSINTGIYQKEKVELTDGEPLMLEGKNDHKTNWIIEANFRGLTGFTNILVGKGPNENLSHGGMWLNITPYAVIPTYSTGAYQGVDHGLTITDYLDVRIESFVDKTDESESYTGSGDATYIRYTLFDGNKQFTLDKVFFMGSEEPFVQVNGISSAKVDLYYWCTDLKNNLWCYGDSYFSIAQTRWPYWILTRGYSALFNAMPGANSEYMWKRFCYDLMCGNPRKVFWCLGMNDTDNGAINANWLKYLTRVIDICRLRGIEVILATIPNTPTMDNSYKNAYIKTLGFKYVDFASAILNAEGTGWIDGMMEDNVHPSKKGAKCLANAAMILFISYK